MDSSGSLERMSRLRFALQTPSPSPSRLPSTEGLGEGPGEGPGDGAPERPERPERSGQVPPQSRHARGDRPAEGAPDGGQIVLLIEDNPAVVAAVAQCLHGAGYQTQCAADVEDAVRKVASRAVALVLLNWGLLTRIGGHDLVAQLRNGSPRTRLPMVVISDEVSALNEASSLGIEDYLLDPFQLEDLLHVVDEYCC